MAKTPPEEEVAAEAVKLFNEGFNCAESVATAVAGALAPGQTCFPRVATCFGGGLGRRGETCGALVGALMAAGLLRGRDEGEGDGAKTRAYQISEAVVERFRDEFGSLACRDLIGLDLSEPAGQAAFKARDVHHTHCARFVAEAARLAYDRLKG